MSRPRYSSNAGIFEKRGNPWVSRREGEKSYGRNLETENPDLDQFTRATKAEPKPRYIDPKPPKREDDFARRKATVLMRMQKSFKKAERRTTVIEAAARQFKPCPGCRKSVCIAKQMCDTLVRGER